MIKEIRLNGELVWIQPNTAVVAKARLLEILIFDQLRTRRKARIARVSTENGHTRFSNPITVGPNDEVKFIGGGLPFVVTIRN